MVAGVPVVASAVGSVPDMITDGVTGRLIPPADGSRMADAVAELLDDVDATKNMIANARRKALETYTIERMVSKYEELFERLASSGPAAEEVKTPA